VDGRDLQLSIDSKVQFFAYQKLREAVLQHKAQAGSVVVLDAQSGEVLALANYPSYSPERRVNLSGAQLHNRALTQPHPDGKDALIQSYTPRNPAIFVSTFRTDEQKAFEYSNDERIWQGMNEPYAYLGRVNQHYRRRYDVYVRADLNAPPLASELVVSTAGTKQRSDMNDNIPGSTNRHCITLGFDLAIDEQLAAGNIELPAVPGADDDRAVDELVVATRSAFDALLERTETEPRAGVWATIADRDESVGAGVAQHQP
jgi:hypothetical protein